MNEKFLPLVVLIATCFACFVNFAWAQDLEVQLKPTNEAALVSSPNTHQGFSEQQLFDALVGELAGTRGEMDLALQKYAKLAFELRDVAVVERAARIANFSENAEQLRELALLWSELAPQSLDARRLSAITLARNGEFLQALPHAGFSLKKEDSEPLMTLAVLAERASIKQREQLIEAFSQHEELLSKNNYWVLFAKAMLLRSNNQLKSAEKLALQAFKQKPESESIGLMLAQIYHQQGNRKKALSTIGKSLKHNPDSKRLLIQQVRFMVDSDLLKARQLLTSLTERYPNDIPFALSLAELNHELGLIDDARRNYLRLTKNPKAVMDAYYQLGVLEQEQGNIDQAIEYLRLVKNKRFTLAVAARLSRMWADSDRLETAQMYLQELRLDHPESAVTLFQIESEMLVEKAEHADAFGVLNNAIEEFPFNIPLLYARSLVGEKLQNFHQAEQDLRHIIELDGDNAIALNALGYTLTIHTDRYEEAHQLIVRALEIEPEDPATLDSLGWVLFHLERYEEAVVPLEKAWEKLQDAEIAGHLSEVYLANDRPEDAKAVLEKVLEVHPDNQQIKTTLEKLQREYP